MKYRHNLSRRKFLQYTAISGFAGITSVANCGNRSRKFGLIKKIKSQIIWPGRTKGTTWFHPRACMIPAAQNPVALMTCQAISGSDVFGQVYWSRSGDNGKSWTEPAPIPSLTRRTLPNGIEEGTCDVVPGYHEKTKKVLAIGHAVYYKNNKLTMPNENRYPAYVIGDENGNWSERKKLQWDHPEISGIYTSGCAQRVDLDNGDILLPLSFGSKERKDRKVCTALCVFDGNELTIKKSGNELELQVNRGLLEPTLAQFKNRFYMTIRAEDDRGYVTVSDDGLNWQLQRPWCWDDGEPLTMSTTQQRWITHSHGLFLVYTRKAENNVNVMRWRAPLYIAQVDTKKLCLIRNSEQVVLPLIGDGINDAKHVARMGNFHTVNASPNESWVTVGETLPDDGWKGDTLLGRVFWNRRNDCAVF
jgi:hypothetical protein